MRTVSDDDRPAVVADVAVDPLQRAQQRHDQPARTCRNRSRARDRDRPPRARRSPSGRAKIRVAFAASCDLADQSTKCAPVVDPATGTGHRLVFDVQRSAAPAATTRSGSSDRRRRRSRRCLLRARRFCDVRGLDARDRCRRGRRSAAAAGCSVQLRSTMPVPSAGPHCTVGTVHRRAVCVTVAEKVTTYGLPGVNAELLARRQAAGVLVIERQRRRAPSPPISDRARLEERLRERRRSRRDRRTDSVNGSAVPPRTVCGTSSSGAPRAS